MSVTEEQVRALYVRGVFGYRRVAQELGTSHTTVRRLLDPDFRERQLRLAREYKRRRRGMCEDCGTETRYNGRSVNGPSRYCLTCANQRLGRETRGQGSVVSRILALLVTGPRRFSEIRDALGLDSNNTTTALYRLHKYGLIVRPSRGVYALAQPSAEDGGEPREERGY